jgi:hypothetical protein
MTKNKTAEYVDAKTGDLLFTEDFIDPELKWVQTPGGWILKGLHGGYPNAQWLADNPRPAT